MDEAGFAHPSPVGAGRAVLELLGVADRVVLAGEQLEEREPAEQPGDGLEPAPRLVMAFASNLLGAVFGGVLEWGALVVGYEALLAIVAVLYLAASLFASRLRLLGDEALTPEGSLA